MHIRKGSERGEGVRTCVDTRLAVCVFSVCVRCMKRTIMSTVDEKRSGLLLKRTRARVIVIVIDD